MSGVNGKAAPEKSVTIVGGNVSGGGRRRSPGPYSGGAGAARGNGLDVPRDPRSSKTSWVAIS